VLDALGAHPLAREVRASLRTIGVARIPRGPVPTTRPAAPNAGARSYGCSPKGMTNAEVVGATPVGVGYAGHMITLVAPGAVGTAYRHVGSPTAGIPGPSPAPLPQQSQQARPIP